MTAALVVGALGSAATASAGQTFASATTIYRVFLNNGTILASYGDAAAVGDRVIFNLAIVRADGSLTLQLISLPASIVDLTRTTQYAQAVRATVYAATRGESEYAAMLAEVGTEVSQIAALGHRAGQLARALAVRQRLAAWPADHYNYRAADVKQLVGWLDGIIDGAPFSSGPQAVTLDLTYDATLAVRPPPSSDDSIASALVAASVADVGEDRVAILRAASASVNEGPLKARVDAELHQELDSEQRYATLGRELRERAEAARRTGSVRTVDQLQGELAARDAALGHRRPQYINALAKALTAALEAARVRRAAIDRFYAVAPQLAAYERKIRPVFSGLSALTPLLDRLRHVDAVPHAQTAAAERRLQVWSELAAGIAPPEDVAGIHATVVSAIGMAKEACRRKQLADVTAREATAREAGSAAAGALLLAERAKADLLAALLPPRD